MQMHDSWGDRADVGGRDRRAELIKADDPLVEQKAGDDFCIAARTWFDAYGGLSPVDPEEVLLALEAGDVSALGEVVGTPMVGISADGPDEALDIELEMALAAVTRTLADPAVPESLYEVTDIRKRVELSTPVPDAAAALTADDMAGSVPIEIAELHVPPPAVLAAPADLEQVESLFASFLRTTSHPAVAAAAPRRTPVLGTPVTDATPAAGPLAPTKTAPQGSRPIAPVRRRGGVHHLEVDDPDFLKGAPERAPAVDPRKVALGLLDEADIYRRFGHRGEARQCVLRARQTCPGDAEIARSAEALAAAIEGSSTPGTEALDGPATREGHA
jgi:hypothetical protein